MSGFGAELIGESPEFQALLRSAAVVAATDVTVLIQGESGTGKELLARALHAASRRAAGPLTTINCAALPEALAESELFGHKKGAFTGAVADHPGRIRAAAGGTLFLDEVGELTPMIQAKLLRFLETGECQPVGGTACTHVDTRLLAATHRDLYTLVQEGRFREDLYYRLNVVPLTLPPLRERTDDILLLLRVLTARLARQHGLSPPHYSLAALRQLKRHAWPGNVRELHNFCERMLILRSGQDIEPDNLPVEFRRQARSAKISFELPDNGICLEELEQTMLRQALERAQGNRSQAARLLGLTRDTFLYRLKKHAIA
jgi:DNA-binding NtrC family response regulator